MLKRSERCISAYEAAQAEFLARLIGQKSGTHFQRWEMLKRPLKNLVFKGKSARFGQLILNCEEAPI